MSTFKIIVASDSVGETGELVTKACLSQFKIDAPDNVIDRYPYVNNTEDVDDVIDLAKSKNAIVVYTLITPTLRKYMAEELNNEEIAYIDVMGPLMDQIAKATGLEPYNEPGRVHRLDEDYFKKIEAIEFAVKYDDGKDTSGLEKADIVLLGVSRTSKTPLSQFLALKKYKVMNVPLVPEVKPPNLLCIQLTVCHLDSDLIQILLLCINIRIAFCLGKMQRFRFFYKPQFSQNTFDLIYCNSGLRFVLFCNNPVCPPFDKNMKAVENNFFFQRDLGMVIRSHSSLYFPMDSAAHQHSVSVHSSGYAVVDIPFSQNKFHKISD